MKPEQYILEQLFETQGFRFFKEPIILVSGELGIYDVNAEKLCRDEDKFNDFDNNPVGMINHTLEMEEYHPEFKKVIDILVEEVSKYMGQLGKNVIAGGQYKSWLFSGPVAKRLILPHIAIFENGEIEHMSITDKARKIKPLDLTQYKAIIVSDSLNTGLSAYSVGQSGDEGWIGYLRHKDRAGAEVRDLVTVVAENQRGEDAISYAGVNPHPLVTINDNFFKQAHKLGLFDKTEMKTCLEYFKDPSVWSENYLKTHKKDYIHKLIRNTENGNIIKRFLEKYEHFI